MDSQNSIRFPSKSCQLQQEKACSVWWAVKLIALFRRYYRIEAILGLILQIFLGKTRVQGASLKTKAVCKTRMNRVSVPPHSTRSSQSSEMKLLRDEVPVTYQNWARLGPGPPAQPQLHATPGFLGANLFKIRCKASFISK